MADIKILEETIEASPSHKWISYLIEGGILLLALLLFLLIRFTVYEPTIVISKSMEPTLEVEDRLIIDHRKSLHHNWQRGDIVMFTSPDTWGTAGDNLIKRIIGLPGETVEVREGQVLINGQPLTETYVRASPNRDNMALMTLGRGHYFVMGDNRGNSEDSRNNGSVPDRFIEGRAVYRYWPFGQFGGLTRVNY